MGTGTLQNTMGKRLPTQTRLHKIITGGNVTSDISRGSICMAHTSTDIGASGSMWESRESKQNERNINQRNQWRAQKGQRNKTGHCQLVTKLLSTLDFITKIRTATTSISPNEMSWEINRRALEMRKKKQDSIDSLI